MYVQGGRTAYDLAPESPAKEALRLARSISVFHGGSAGPRKNKVLEIDEEKDLKRIEEMSRQLEIGGEQLEDSDKEKMIYDLVDQESKEEPV